MDEKYTDEQIVIVLRLMSHLNVCREAYGLINRQKAEIERLTKENEEQHQAIINALHRMGEIRSEAIKEFAKRLKSTMFNEDFLLCEPCDMADIIDNLVKEMTEGKGNEM